MTTSIIEVLKFPSVSKQIITLPITSKARPNRITGAVILFKIFDQWFCGGIPVDICVILSLTASIYEIITLLNRGKRDMITIV
jgi:hypothetical protein